MGLRLALSAVFAMVVGCGGPDSADRSKSREDGNAGTPADKQLANSYEIIPYYPRVIANDDPGKYKVVVSAPKISTFETLVELDDPSAYEKVLVLRLTPVEDKTLNVNASAYELVPSTYEVFDAQLTLRPKEPLIPGRGYVALVDPKAIPGNPAPDARKLERWFAVPGGEAEAESEGDSVEPEPDDDNKDIIEPDQPPLESNE
jgi:hypothetical protein